MAKPASTVKGVSVAQMMVAAQKEMGEDVGQIGGDFPDTDRIPSGMMEFDVATGGGIPRGKVTIIYGNESASKTVHAMLLVANHQKLWPEKTCAYIALEGYSNSDREWFRKLGVDVDKLAVFQPTYAEQVVDIMDSFCWAHDAGLIVLDSIAAMMTVSEFENSAEKKSMGGASIPIATMVRKTTTALNKAPSTPTIIYISQNRTKIGVMYGNPETFAGGNFIRFQAAMIIRLWGKNEMDPKISKAMPVIKSVTMRLDKWKVPVVAQKSEYQIVMIPHKGLRPGQSDWFNTFKTYATALGLLKKAEEVPDLKDEKGKKAKGWYCFEQVWPTLDALKHELYSDLELCQAIIQDLISQLTDNDELLAAQEGD